MQNSVQSGPFQEKPLSSPSLDISPIRLEIDYDSEVSSSLFKAKGCLVLWGNRSLPYLILNATLLKAGRPVSSTKYMMIEIEPNRENSFDISKNMRISPGSYSCVLEVLSPTGQMASEARECRMVEPFFAELPVPEPKPRPSTAKLSSAKPSSVKPSPAQEEPLEVREARPSAEEERAEAREEELPMPSGRPEESVKSPEWTKEGSKVSSDNTSSEDEDLRQKGVESNNASLDGSLVGSTSSNKYHLPSCRYAVKIRPENRVYFANEEEAKRKGYLPCKTCNP